MACSLAENFMVHGPALRTYLTCVEWGLRLRAAWTLGCCSLARTASQLGYLRGHEQALVRYRLYISRLSPLSLKRLRFSSTVVASALMSSTSGTS